MITSKYNNIIRFLRPYWTTILVVLVIVVAVELLNDHYHLDRPVFSLTAVGLLVTSLSIFLVFRVNESYARWWEARMLWGQLVNASRAFARQVTTLIRDEKNDDENQSELQDIQESLVYRQIAFVNALRLSLRGEETWDELNQFLREDDIAKLEQAVNKPSFLLQRQGEHLADTRGQGILSEFGQNQFDRTFRDLHNVQGGCERIKNTPFPQNVAYVTRGIAWIMALAIAIAIMDEENQFDMVDMIVVPIMMLSFILIERLGAELKNPFENAPNDTPMTALCRTIERDLRQVIGEKELPPAIEPVKDILM